MKKALKILATLLISFLAIIGLATVIVASFFDGAKDYMTGHIDRVTNQEAYEYDIDKIEVFLLMQPEGKESLGSFQVSRHSDPVPYYNTTTIEGEAAAEMARLWSSTHKSLHSGGMCFTPPYGIKMYSKGELTFQGAICWHCSRYKSDSIPFTADSGFIADSSTAQQMLKLLDQQLPYPKPKHSQPKESSSDGK